MRKPSQKLWKATLSSVMSVRLSVRQNATARLQLDGFSWNTVFEYILKIFDKIQVLLNSDTNNGYFYADLRTFFITSRSVLLTMRNVSDKSCRENQNTYFVFNNIFPPKSCPLWNNVKKKYCRAGQATHYNMAQAHFLLYTWSYKHKLRICNTFSLSTTAVVARTRLSLTLYAIACLVR